jgi:hypothetical protein
VCGVKHRISGEMNKLVLCWSELRPMLRRPVFGRPANGLQGLAVTRRCRADRQD